MRVLVSAYACEPGRGSEQEVGWQWVRQIARFCATTVLTRANDRPRIERALSQEPNLNLRFEYIDLPARARFWKRGQRGVHAYYALWQILAAKKAIQLHHRQPFDLVHHLTFVVDWAGPGMAVVPTKLVWGPIGSSPPLPPGFAQVVGRRTQFTDVARRFLRVSAPYRSPLFALALNRAAVVIASNRESGARLSRLRGEEVVTIAQNGMPASDLCLRPKELGRSRRLLNVGHLSGIKGQRLVIAAFAKVRRRGIPATLRMVGAGREEQSLRSLAVDLGIARWVHFCGHVPRAQVFEHMRQADLFLFPSCEGGGMVVIEAMAQGLPVVCLDHGGPGDYVDGTCGIKVPAAHARDTSHRLAGAIERIFAGSQNYRRLSLGARARVAQHYTWEQKGHQLEKLYRRALHGSQG